MNLSEGLYKKLSLYCQKHKVTLTENNFEQIAKVVFSKEEYSQCFLQDEVLKKIESLALKGNDLFDEERYIKAIEVFKEGLNSIPAPKEEWEASLWFYTSISDSYWYLKEFEYSLASWNKCLEVVGGKENIFVRFRRAQTLFELSFFDEAFEEFEIYVKLENEKKMFHYEDKKYLNFYQNRHLI